MGFSTTATSVVLAAVNFIEPAAAPSYPQVVANVAYTQVCTRASYLQVKVCAEVTFPDVLAVDVVTPTDLVTLEFDKTLADHTNGFADLLAKSVGKTFADSVSETDSLKFTFAKILADIANTADTKQITFGKALADVATPSELIHLEAIKALADTLGAPTDAVALGINKALAESVSFSDAIQTSLIFIRTFADTLSSTDSLAFGSNLAKADNATPVDTTALSTDKQTSDNLYLIDNMDANIQYEIVKVIGELLLNSDSQVIDFMPNKADNVTTSSSGYLLMQDYCDITYFLEDYVGYYRTFT